MTKGFLSLHDHLQPSARVNREIHSQNNLLRAMMSLVMLKKRSEYIRVKGGPKWVSSAFILQARKRAQSGEITRLDQNQLGPRFGITVSNRTAKSAPKTRVLPKKTDGKHLLDAKANSKNRDQLCNNRHIRRGPVSVTRNRIRRRLREALRLTAPELAQKDVDYVLIGRQAALNCTFQDLNKDMQIAFNKVNHAIHNNSQSD